jgi:hypothetical protein
MQFNTNWVYVQAYNVTGDTQGTLESIETLIDDALDQR